MCGRFVVARATGDLVGDWSVDDVEGDDPAPSWNVAPTTTVRMVADRRPRDDADGGVRRVLTDARWGIVPPWARSPQGPPLINARVETVTEKPTFRRAVLTRRAIVPADGYYEWQATASGKQPVYLHGEDERPLAFAAVYEHWRDPAVPDGEPGAWLRSLAIITSAASDALGHIHDRTPVIVPRDRVDDWLDAGTTAVDDVRHLLGGLPEPRLVPRLVSTRVNSVRNDGPDLIAPLDEAPGDDAQPTLI
ncbi:SOS response-associated peptidase [Clavibacter lycopersici]|uniref:Abasic site processing protein n=1 Tax=Clavibacter lycopersici TaxID=2301718 RepID=A0A399TDK7_9MICO|nr:SOS response-associated peptidase [Clavibacter lycopersici]RIJ53212.1 SOS response-associated peptidase [Clavibacter lycopersici]RIJ62635.1 SOS response-associated peptidase [Clavibacter lycopersici]